MKKIEISAPIQIFAYSELDEAERELVDAAREAVNGSYAPYSKFRVGAAIRLENGVIVQGANQENVAYPSGTCAERSACFYAGAKYKGVPFSCIAIAAVGTDGKATPQPVAPCGACRQSLLEYEMLAGHNVPVLLVGANEVYKLESIKTLLPLAFSEF